MVIPSLLLKKLYTLGSLNNAGAGVQFSIKNRLADGELSGVRSLSIDGRAIALDTVKLREDNGNERLASQIDSEHPVAFPLRAAVTIQTAVPALAKGKHEIEI